MDKLVMPTSFTGSKTENQEANTKWETFKTQNNIAQSNNKLPLHLPNQWQPISQLHPLHPPLQRNPIQKGLKGPSLWVLPILWMLPIYQPVQLTRLTFEHIMNLCLNPFPFTLNRLEGELGPLLKGFASLSYQMWFIFKITLLGVAVISCLVR